MVTQPTVLGCLISVDPCGLVLHCRDPYGLFLHCHDPYGLFLLCHDLYGLFLHCHDPYGLFLHCLLQINHMKRFIEQEAREKAEEIAIKVPSRYEWVGITVAIGNVRVNAFYH